MVGSGEAGRPYNSCMPFIAKATSIDSGAATWLTTPRLHGLRTFGTRVQAEKFEAEAGATAAIHEMIVAEDCRGLRFSVEAAD
jgi:hypothetical protein